ncbi:MAG: XdhC family protein [Flavobacteriales bacterium]|nr:XdhC family protein [Flavobacteriales bacterium]
MDLYERTTQVRDGKEPAALCIIVSTRGSTPRRVGAKMLVLASGNIHGTIGGGELERSVIQQALEVIRNGQPALRRHDLVQHHGMCCGGSVDIYIEPVMKKNKLYIFGAGHTGTALAKLAHRTGFEVFVVDERKDQFKDLADTPINQLPVAHDQVLPSLPFDERSYIAIMTYSHPMDRDILAFCLKKPFAYLGMIGSQRKVEMTRKMFQEGGIATVEELARVDMPMGIDIGAEGPEEIAVSILAELIRVKNQITAS